MSGVEQNRMPRSRRYLITTRVGAETLVYDPATHASHRLDAAGAALFAACDGVAPLDQAAAALHPGAAADVAREALALGLRRLHKAGVLEGLPADLPRVSRRGFLARWGKVAVALPVVSTLLAPQPAYAQSPPCINCTGTSGDCAACPADLSVCFAACQGSAATCADCQCMTYKRKDGASCTTDTTIRRVCINLNVAQPAYVNFDCAVARANANDLGGSQGSFRNCDGTTTNNGLDYVCCFNCA